MKRKRFTEDQIIAASAERRSRNGRGSNRRWMKTRWKVISDKLDADATQRRRGLRAPAAKIERKLFQDRFVSAETKV